jgi:hypothetical protein
MLFSDSKFEQKEVKERGERSENQMGLKDYRRKTG